MAELQHTPTDSAYFIILSGTYCTAEVAAEFGNVPPSFLPIGQTRLIYRQIEMARRCEAQPVLSLPADYELPCWDAAKLAADGVRIVRTPASLTLNEAVQFVLEIVDARGTLHILYGDTLVDMPELGTLDIAAVSTTESNYNWSDAHTGSDGTLNIVSGYGEGDTQRNVLCGYFAFSDAYALRKACVKARNFDESLMDYARHRGLHTKVAIDWYDFGHISLVYQSRKDVMVSRAFNSIRTDGAAVVKTSSNRAKIEVEAAWYTDIPAALRPFTPHFLGFDPERGEYRVEYLYLPTLAELFTYGELPTHVWRQILGSCCKFLEECRRHRPGSSHSAADTQFAEHFFHEVFEKKTQDRVEAFRSARNWSHNMPLEINGVLLPSLSNICDRLRSYILPTNSSHVTLWHGDFFFGNIFFDFRAARIRVIDPRGGLCDEEQSIYGDYRYDLAKLAHSITGGYDMLLAGHVNMEVIGDGRFLFERHMTPLQSEVAKAFELMEVEGQPVVTLEIRAMTALLFLTMLPLHADDRVRQDVMLCSGLTLALELFDMTGEKK